MRFTQLRLTGFKSFLERSEFVIEGGLTGVVGPNGCGKSNLVEALRWVMGEASHKAMRASDMEDVIFSGSVQCPGRNQAEVELIVDNSERNAPAAFNDSETIEVSRRIVREQGSTFRVNGREVRARDVAMLFADASTGSRSPALVHQGRIGEIIRARPEQRRRVLEEAAGISGLHARRHEADLRLKAGEHNLARVDDVIGQLAAQIAALKTQARQADRYRTSSRQVRCTEALLFHLRWIAVGADLAEAERAKNEALRVLATRSREHTQASTRQHEIAARLPAVRATQAEAIAALECLVVERQTLERQEARAGERAEELSRQLEQFSADLERQQLLATDASTALERLDAEQAALKADVRANALRLSAMSVRTAVADAALARSERTFVELTGALAELSARRRQLQTVLHEHDERATRLSTELLNIETGLAATDKNEPDLATIADALAAGHAALIESEAAMRDAEIARVSAREHLKAVSESLVPPERSVQRLETEANTISKLLALDDSKNVRPAVLDAMVVANDYEKALGAALSDDLDAPVGDSAPMRWAGVESDAADPALPADSRPLGQFVEGPPELARRLAQIGIVDRNDGPRLAKMLKPGQRLVSREGDLWRWDGFAVAAHAPSGAARRLAARGRLQAIQGELANAGAEIETRRHAVVEAEAALAAALAAETQAVAQWRGAKCAIDYARRRSAACEREIGRNAARISALEEAQRRIVASRDEAVRVGEEAGRSLAALPPSAELNARLAAINETITGERTARAQLQIETHAIAREMDRINRRLRAIASERTEWSRRKENAATQIVTIAGRSIQAESERNELKNAPQVFAERKRSLIGEITAATAACRATTDRLVQAENDLAEAEAIARAVLETVGEARADTARADVRGDAAKHRLANVAHEIREAFDTEPAGAAALAEIEPGAELPLIAEVEDKLDRVRRERERLGAVNLRAEQELSEVETQHHKLVAERENLVEAIRRLRHGIHSLNYEARERLLASFATVNVNFKKLFTELFGGGTAELQLIEHEDPLEAGLEVVARPLGKKPATLSLLSGGEQALTALALIFAVFLTNPAPICVLDEAEASLDDYNVELFCNLLRHMTRSTDTRFIIITHNPITMARMNRLYGVTMAERGVSQLVSIDLEGAAKMRDGG